MPEVYRYKGRRGFKSFESKHLFGEAIYVEVAMYESSGFQMLSPYAKILFIHLKWKQSCNPSQPLIYTRSEATVIMNEKTFVSARDELIRGGFIDIVENNSEVRKPHILAFSDRWRKNL